MENNTDKIDYSWHSHAVCKDMHVNAFFVGQGKRIGKEAVEACASCPVQKQCLDHALKYEDYGYWAGTNPVDRRKMRVELGINIISINYEYMNKVEPLQTVQEYANISL